MTETKKLAVSRPPPHPPLGPSRHPLGKGGSWELGAESLCLDALL